MTTKKALEIACELLMDKVFETSENYKMEKPERGFEREFAAAKDALSVLKGLAAGR